MAQVQVQPQPPISGVANGTGTVGVVVGANNGGNGNGNNQFVTTSLYVGDLEVNVTDSQLYDLFSQLGQVVSGSAQGHWMCLTSLLLNGKPIRIMYSHRDPSIRSKSGTANIFVKNLDKAIDNKGLYDTFCSFGTISLARRSWPRSVGALNGKKFDEKEWFVGKAQKKTDREVMRDPNGISRGSGFVAFSTPEEATRALTEMNGKMVGSKPLYVALAQRKEDRKARLQAQFSQMRPVAIAASVGPQMPMYPWWSRSWTTNILWSRSSYSHSSPGSYPGFGYQQQLVPGMRPAGAPMPNFFMPMVQQQGQQGQRQGGRRAGAGPVQQTQQQPMPMMQQQMLPRGRMYRYPPGRNMGEVPIPGVAGTLATALANATPEQQLNDVGLKSLYPLVDQLEHDLAAKVTGMLLEMDQPEVLHLLESPEALKV
ncbi:hypothetical protein IFM89_039892 [Coptis chinensis]|uniref:Polyadenylate-binding protein n=1 Tax=Coptis chinensis TaxID=261450 RepID=A0A835LGW0_9MAGN|nr:hypothetical protein IFM89_039892 [Coptis chinensis]